MVAYFLGQVLVVFHLGYPSVLGPLCLQTNPSLKQNRASVLKLCLVLSASQIIRLGDRSGSGSLLGENAGYVASLALNRAYQEVIKDCLKRIEDLLTSNSERQVCIEALVVSLIRTVVLDDLVFYFLL